MSEFDLSIRVIILMFCKRIVGIGREGKKKKVKRGERFFIMVCGIVL